MILLTNSDDIISWARLEVLTGALSLVGPGEGTSSGRSRGAEAPGTRSGDSELENRSG